MVNPYAATRIPSRKIPNLDWTVKRDLLVSNRNGANTGFTYVFPVSKYVEAYALGPTYNNPGAYYIANQPYAYKDYSGRPTPKNPNWMSLQKVSPKGSAPGIQDAQVRMAQLLASRNGSIVKLSR